MSFSFCRLKAASRAVALVAAAGCSDSDAGPAPIEKTQFAESLGIDLSQMTKLPSGVYYRDLSTGNGAVAANGIQASIHYVGQLANGKQFDANRPPTAPFDFVLGGGRVIPGFDEGVRDMKVGGRRTVIIPPELGYGPAGSGPIPPNAILVFQIDLVDVK